MRSVCALLALVFASVGWEAAAQSLARTDASFTHRGHRVAVEVIRPATQEPLPAVLVLHGASGKGRGYYIDAYAAELAARGLAVFIVGYFDGLGTRVGRPSSTAHFHVRDAVIRSAIDYALSRRDVRQGPVGIYGFSLGGFHALSVAAADTRVGAVVSMGGALSRHIDTRSLNGMPPVLLLHGTHDSTVPFGRTIEVGQALERIGTPFEMTIYPRNGHQLRAAVRDDTIGRTADFLARWLHRRPAPAS
jgi:dienelactone hydrolase